MPRRIRPRQPAVAEPTALTSVVPASTVTPGPTAHRGLTGLPLRVVSAVVLLGVVGMSLWTGGVVFDVVLGLAVAVGVWEYSGLMRRVGTAPPAWLIYPLSGWLLYRFLLPGGVPALEVGLGVAVVMGLLGGLVMTGPVVSRWAAAVGGALYLGLCAGYYLALLNWRPGDGTHFGLRLVILPLLAAIAGDTAAYCTGSVIGRHRFFSAYSPRKSLEGAIGGALVAILAVGVVAPWLTGMTVWQAVLLGGLLTVAAQGGDLVESAVKRQAGVKDASRLIPGHGGLLDRLDSLLLLGPVVYCFLRVIALR